VKIARPHPDEQRRIDALEALHLLDTDAEHRFDRLARLAALIIDAPIALISLVDRERQWFKASVGLDRTETGRDESFCAHAIAADDGLFVVPDTALDDRFDDNPLVVGEPRIRFYAGQPVHSPDGFAVGTLCVMDDEPRVLEPAQRLALAHLGELVEQEFERRTEMQLLAELATSQRLLDATLDVAPVGLVVLDLDRTIIRCNRTFGQHVGRDPRDLVGIDVTTLIEPEDLGRAVAVGHELRKRHEVAMELDHRIVRPDGSHVWVNTHLAVIADPDRPLGVAATFDVTERRTMALALDRFSHLFHHANDLVTVIDERGRLLYASPSNERLLGHPLDRRHPDGVLGMVHPDDLTGTRIELLHLIEGTRDSTPFTCRVVSAAGVVHHLECVGVNLLDEPAVRGIVLTARDVTERVRLGELLSHRAAHDPLTNLANRQLLESSLTASLARAARDGHRVGLCFIDLDGFKQVNDKAGHAAGDHLIVAVADSIRRSIREGDLAARIGGDEFVIVLDPVAGEPQALAVAQRVRAVLLAAVCGPADVSCGASIGLAVSQPGDGVSALMHRADAAMYRAKARRDSSLEVAGDRPAHALA
jgi:diguanylate cyclase (GGDEF)-like protein/PAS domain S-box-containing protein